MSTPSIPLEAELTLFRDKLMGFRRRRSRRFRCSLATLGKVQFAGDESTLDAFVYNLSETGVGLNMSSGLDAGREIVLRIRLNGALEPLRLAARVVHSTEEMDRTWRIGCEFKEPLSAEVLDKMLE